MWRDVAAALGDAGGARSRRTCRDTGDSVDRPGTWERHVEAVERFRAGLGLAARARGARLGGLIGLRWAATTLTRSKRS